MNKACFLFAALLWPASALAQQGFPPAQPATQTTATADVLTRAVSRGDIFTAADFESATLSAPMAKSALRARDAIGKSATRNIMAGSSLRYGDVAPPALVRRGEPVVLSMRTGAFTVSAPGRALGDGAAGSRVRVVNLATNHTLDAIVEGTGRVAIMAP